MVPNNVYLAPLAGITDTAMREMCVQCGADMTFTEMVSAKGIQYNNEKTRKLLDVSPLEKRVGVQLFGNERKVLAMTARRVQDMLGDVLSQVNLNMGCPVPKVVRNGEGAALMLEPKKAADIIGAVARAVTVPVTVKFRKGFDDEHINAVAFAKMCAGKRRGAGCRARQDTRPVLFRTGGLGDYPAGEGGGQNSRGGKRRHLYARRRKTNDG